MNGNAEIYMCGVASTITLPKMATKHVISSINNSKLPDVPDTYFQIVNHSCVG
jgi:hypothetical protein